MVAINMAGLELGQEAGDIAAARTTFFVDIPETYFD